MAAKNAVEAPTIVITNNAVGLYSNIGEHLNNKYIPAVTRVQKSLLIIELEYVFIQY